MLVSVVYVCCSRTHTGAVAALLAGLARVEAAWVGVEMQSSQPVQSTARTARLGTPGPQSTTSKGTRHMPRHAKFTDGHELPARRTHQKPQF